MAKNQTKFDPEKYYDSHMAAESRDFPKSDLSIAQKELNLIIEATSDYNHGYLTSSEVCELVNFIERI